MNAIVQIAEQRDKSLPAAYYRVLDKIESDHDRNVKIADKETELLRVLLRWCKSQMRRSLLLNEYGLK